MDDVVLIGSALVFLAILTVWLVAARPEVLRKIGRACLNTLVEAGKWYVEPYLDSDTRRAATCRVEPARSADPPAAEAEAAAEAAESGTGEAAMVIRLLDGSLAKADYHAAMAELARLDADRHPLSLPPAGP